MLEINDQEYLDKVRKFADKIGMRDDLESALKYLATYACHDDSEKTKCMLFRDFAPYSFEFSMQIRQEDGSYKHWFNGGCIFHGAHDNGGDGRAPTFSVNLTPTTGWSIHT